MNNDTQKYSGINNYFAAATPKDELFEKIFNLETELENPDTSYEDYQLARVELAEAKDDYTELCKAECIAEHQHFVRTTSSGGYDVCLNCGGKS